MNRGAWGLTLCLAVGTAGSAADAADILNTDSYWRWHLTLRKPIVPVEALKVAGIDAAEPRVLSGRQQQAPYSTVDHQVSPPPPAGWEQPDFDDRDWPRAGAKRISRHLFGRFSSAAVCLRGKFTVTDPLAARGLTLTLEYRGGAVVYLNGKEIARGDMPQGPLAPETPANPYPLDVHVDARGRPIPSSYHRRRLSAQERKDMDARVAKRNRSLGSVTLPAAALRRGVNVLAVEIRRSEYPAAALRWFGGKYGRGMPSWLPIGLSEIRLEAPDGIVRRGSPLSLSLSGRGRGDGRSSKGRTAPLTPPSPRGGEGDGAVVPNVSRPKGLQVWTDDRSDRICVLDYGDPNEPLQPVRLVGGRNGSFSGQVVVSSTAPITGIKATADALQHVNGAGIIAASEITVLYARPDIAFYGWPAWFDGLQHDAPSNVPVSKYGGAAVQPVIVRVHVPKGAAPGDYRGVLTIQAMVPPAARPPVRRENDGTGGQAARGTRIDVPIELHVADWTIPDPRDYRTYVGIYQSPTSLALQYNVPEWSEEHWRLMERSFALLARAGNKLVNITVIEQTQFGNDEGMIYWVRKPDGSFDYDFTVFDRYMALARKHFGTLDYVALHVWHSGGWQARKPDQRNTVTVIDERTGKHERMQVPRFGTEASKRFWKPLLDAVRKRLAAMEMEDAMCLGILSDGTAAPEVFTAFNEIVPGEARWMRGLHTQTRAPAPYGLKGGGKVVLHEFCYGLYPANPEKPLPPFWGLRGRPGTAYDRISNHEIYAPLTWYRNTGMMSLLRSTQGIGRICLDFWDVIKGGRRGKTWIYNRYPHSSCAQRAPSLQKLTWSGPAGAETTIRYEALCEGIQDAEALIAVSEAVDRHSDKLGEALTRECRQVLVDLLRHQRFGSGPRSPLRTNHRGWQEISKRLYTCAARAGRKLGPVR